MERGLKNWMGSILSGTVFFIGGLKASESGTQAYEEIPLDRVSVVAADGFPRQELVKHLELVSGAKAGTDGDFRIILGEKAPGSGATEPFSSYGRRVGGSVYLWGDDSEGRHGTLSAVYGFLETCLGVRWVYPGDDGIVVTPAKTVQIPRDWNWSYAPPLQKSRIRGIGFGTYDGERFAKYEKYLPLAMRGNEAPARQAATDDYVWGLRMRHQTREEFSLGHAFRRWNERFYRSHPEFLAMDENGRRGTPDFKSSKARFMKLCVSNEAVVDRIVADWIAGGKQHYLNICPNDAKGYCRCEKCCALDCPLSSDEPFDLHKTDRYVNFWNRVAAKVLAIRPDAVICTYIYESYRQPPRREKIRFGENMLFGVVLREDDDNDACIAGWRKAGVRRFVLRPNSLCYHGVLPRGYERFLYDNFMTAYANGMVGCDYDGWLRRPLDFESYVVARLIADPSKPFETIEREFLSQYGAAAPVMKEYYERIRERGTNARLRRMRLPEAEKEVAGDDSQMYKGMLESHTREALAEDMEVLKRAAAVPGLSDVERRRVELRVLMGEHAARTYDFLAARFENPRRHFVRAGLDLIKYRIGVCRRLPEQWGRLFRAFRCEVQWWRTIRDEVKRLYPEMELDD